MAFARRIEKLRAIMRDADLDLLALIPGPNLRYLTGTAHFMSERPLLMFFQLSGKPVAVVSKLEQALFARHKIASELCIWSDAEGYAGAFKAALSALDADGKTIGVEGGRLRFFEGELIRSFAPSANVVDADEALVELRIKKEQDEIDALRTAIRMSEEALQMTLDGVRPGLSEREIANRLEANLKAVGGEGLSFPTILRGGANSALPHSQAEEYVLCPGDPLLFDFGATYNGYHADITRTVFVGEPSPEHRAFYEAVRTANDAGRRAARSGISAESVDRAARQPLIAAGYEHLIRHRTGHGIGLEIHERPFIVEGNKRTLEPGMVFSVEPGIYRIGEIGVRIEDDVLITPDGSESLTTFPRELMVVG